MEREELLAHRTLLLALARRLTGNESDAEDLLQDCFERAMRGSVQLRDAKAARSWLISILRNAFLDRCRRQRAELQGQDTEPPEDLPCPEPADEPAWAHLGLEDLHRALEDLEPEFREVYELREFEGLSYKEIGKRLGVPVATVATRLFRGRFKLRQLLSRMKRKARHD
ncbi:MAG TPA: sigma-70 family RNA polymerase sigma factor [Myxococcaceae bacterium]|jgi:RNA polymerase sigma-70 factor (ECF subfamily)